MLTMQSILLMIVGGVLLIAGISSLFSEPTLGKILVATGFVGGFGTYFYRGFVKTRREKKAQQARHDANYKYWLGLPTITEYLDHHPTGSRGISCRKCRSTSIRRVHIDVGANSDRYCVIHTCNRCDSDLYKTG